MTFNENDHPRDKDGKFTDGKAESSADRINDTIKSSFPYKKAKEEHPDLTEDEICSIIESTPSEAFGFSKDRISTKHHKRHCKDMGFKNEKEYEKSAISFWNDEEGRVGFSKRRGVYCKYNKEKQLFLTISPTGEIKTFYKATSKSIEDYERQDHILWL